jgi:hypothetical protein
MASLFGPTDEAGRRAVARNGKIMDWLKEDVQRVKNQLSGGERAKLDAYTDSLERLQSTQAKIFERTSAAKCARPETSFDLSKVEGRVQSMFELTTASLLCGVTNVVTLSLCTGRAFGAFWTGLGYTIGSHGLGHGASDPKFGTGDGEIQRFQAENIARMLGQLASVPEGAGTALDNTTVMWANENGSSHHSRPHQPFPVLLIGSASGALKPGGRYVRYPFSSQGPTSGGASVADFYRTLAKAFGRTLSGFGSGGAASTRESLPELI